MELSNKEAILLCVNALPTADVWHEITQESMIEIHQQANRELARLEGVLLKLRKFEDELRAEYSPHAMNLAPESTKMDAQYAKGWNECRVEIARKLFLLTAE